MKTLSTLLAENVVIQDLEKLLDAYDALELDLDAAIKKAMKVVDTVPRGVNVKSQAESELREIRKKYYDITDKVKYQLEQEIKKERSKK